MSRFGHSDQDERGAVAVEERTRPAPPDRREVLERQREEYGGFSWGADFFGWLSAVGVATLLLALVAATGAAIGITSSADASSTVGIVGGILMLLVLMLAYYCGGYVAGRMARFNGPRQGLAVWLIGLAGTMALAAPRAARARPRGRDPGPPRRAPPRAAAPAHSGGGREPPPGRADRARRCPRR